MKDIIPSDNLLRLRELLLNWAPLFRLLELLPQFRLVIDTNVVIEELLFIVKSRRNPLARTSLQEAVDSGIVVALAPFKLCDEVNRHIPRLAAENGVSEEALLRAWLEYQSRISYVDVEPISIQEGSAEVVDPDDLPFVYLYSKINADAVVSRDKHISAMGARSIKLEVLIHVRDYAREKTPEITLRLGAFVITAPVVAGVLALGKLLHRAVKGFSRLPPGSQLALFAGALAVGAHPRSRKALSAFVSAQILKLKEPAWAFLSVLDALTEELDLAERKVRAKQEILARTIPRAAKMPLKLMARSICLQAGSPLTAEDIVRGVMRAGYKSKAMDLKHYMLRVLRWNELFINTPDGRWTV